MMGSVFPVVILSALVLQGAPQPGPSQPAPTGNAAVVASGSIAPLFDLPDISGKRLRLDEYRGRTVVLNFWAFWCDTWKAEMPHLRELAKRQDELNFRIVAISVDGTRLPEFAPAASAENRFPVALDVGGQVSGQYGIAHVPTVVILDPQGRVQYTCVAWPGNQLILNRLRALSSSTVQMAAGTKVSVVPVSLKQKRRQSNRHRARTRS